MALSSAYWNSTIADLEILLLARNLRRLKSFPSKRNAISINCSGILGYAMRSTTDIKMENSVGAFRQPCFTPVFTSNGVEAPSLTSAVDVI